MVSEFSLIYGSETGRVKVEFVRSASPQNIHRYSALWIVTTRLLNTLNTPLHSEHTFVNPFLIVNLNKSQSQNQAIIGFYLCNSINFMYILTNLYYIALWIVVSHTSNTKNPYKYVPLVVARLFTKELSGLQLLVLCVWFMRDFPYRLVRNFEKLILFGKHQLSFYIKVITNLTWKRHHAEIPQKVDDYGLSYWHNRCAKSQQDKWHSKMTRLFVV